MSRKPPYPPNETADELRAVLRRNHPELSDAELDALLSGEPARRKRPINKRLENAGRRESPIAAGSAPGWAVRGAVARRRRG